MSSDAQSLVNEATDLINAGDFAEALAKANAALALDPNSGDAALAKAVALSQLGNASDASQSFDLAIRLAPGNAKARFNAAVHEFNQGNVVLARTLAEQAIQLEPDHEGAKGLLARMPAPAQQVAAYPRNEGSEFEVENAGLPFIHKLGAKWVAIAWLLVVSGAVSFAYLMAIMLPNIGKMMTAMQSNDQQAINQIAMAGSNPALQIFGYAHLAAAILWMILDLIHRKGNMVWLVAHIPCSCCGFSFLTLPIYLLTGRK